MKKLRMAAGIGVVIGALIAVNAGAANITGTPGHDVIVGTEDPDVINGLAGNDRIEASGGLDIVVGAAGNDTLIGGEGEDYLFGFSGHDTIYAEEETTGPSQFNRFQDHVLAGVGDDTVYAQDGVRDHIDCGDGFDVAFLDPEDLESGCESVNPS